MRLAIWLYPHDKKSWISRYVGIVITANNFYIGLRDIT